MKTCNGQEGKNQKDAQNTVEVKILSRKAIEKMQNEAFRAGWKAFKKNMIIGYYWGNEYDGQEISVEEAYVKWREKGRR